MFWLYLVILSNFLFAVVYALDKIIVKKAFSPLAYALIIGGLEGVVVVLIPFVDFLLPSWPIILAAIASGIFFICGLYFYFKILLKYEASWVTPILFGVFTPIITFVLGQFFLNEAFSFLEIFALIFLIAGGFILSLARGHKFSAILFLLIAAFFMSSDYVLLKIVFNNANFWTGYILSRLGGFLIAASVLFILKRNPAHEFDVRPAKRFNIGASGALLIFKQVLAFIGNLALLYAIFLSSPTLVNGLGGIKYVFLFFLIIIFARKWPALMAEQLNWKKIIQQLIAIIFIIFGVLALLIVPSETLGAKIWGVDFSSLYAKQIGLDYKETLNAIINDLKVKEFRLSAHWSEIEKIEGDYDFSELDFQVETIEQSGGKIILAVGKRLPRWPECHEPEWIKNEKAEIKNEKLVRYIETVINRYKNNSAIWAWQVENEPFLWGFGECPLADDEFFDKEISLVKELDKTRPIILTDSGEFGRWQGVYKRADIFGTTMYRVVELRFLPIGHFKYPLSPEYFKIKAGIMESLFGKKQIINIELQAEPWLKKRPPEMPLEEQLKAFDINQFKENIKYAEEVGFERNYLWGSEWWFWMREKQNHQEFWEEAKELFSFK